VVTLFYLEQKSYEDVSAMLGMPMGTVKTFLFRARQTLLKLASRVTLPPVSDAPLSRPTA
jgi:DNA-directed RNA polymerase specialized sigma24 family protein